MDNDSWMPPSKAISHLSWNATPRILALSTVLTKNLLWQEESIHPFKWYPPSPEADAVLNCIEMQRHLDLMIFRIPFTCWLLMSASWVVSLWFLSWRLLSGLEHHIQEAQSEFCVSSFIKILSCPSSDSHFIIYQNTCFLSNGHEAAQNTVVFSI